MLNLFESAAIKCIQFVYTWWRLNGGIERILIYIINRPNTSVCPNDLKHILLHEIDFRIHRLPSVLAGFLPGFEILQEVFSYRYFARKAGLNSPILLKLIIDGKRNLSRKTIDKFIAGINLKEKAAVYFRTLVLFNQAASAQEKQDHYRVLRSLYRIVPQHLIEDEQFEYFDKWYYSVLREGICHHDLKDDWNTVAACVRPRITPEQAKARSSGLLIISF
jgi:hypothetical protein